MVLKKMLSNPKKQIEEILGEHFAAMNGDFIEATTQLLSFIEGGLS